MMTMSLWSTAVVGLAIAAVAVASSATGDAEEQTAARSVPWAIDAKPMPKGTDLEVLLPAAVGDFKRDRLPKGSALKSDEDLIVTYRSALESVEVGLSRPDAIADVREALNVTRDEARRSGVDLRRERRWMDSDPRYFTAGDFAAWSRDRYFFFAKATSAEALDHFMRVFPY